MVSINTLVGHIRVGLTMVSINTLVGHIRVGLAMVSINTLVGHINDHPNTFVWLLTWHSVFGINKPTC